MRLLLVFSTLALIFFYALLQKNQLAKKFSPEISFSKELIKTIPDFKFISFATNQEITLRDFWEVDTRGLIVHFWATWCAPCEEEFPSLLNFIKKNEDSKIKFLLVAVNDDVIKIKKFLEKNKTLPKNMILALDNSGQTLDLFGTEKLPETYLFDSQKKIYTKWIGPQDWQAEYYQDQLSKIK
ncbi:MAG: TlpA family protein disulfide reductase [Bacteriovoracaceae bacterium]|nr:TlpA family protein disulfide reductase [Bacteriovoracaceae bacterium]